MAELLETCKQSTSHDQDSVEEVSKGCKRKRSICSSEEHICRCSANTKPETPPKNFGNMTFPLAASLEKNIHCCNSWSKNNLELLNINQKFLVHLEPSDVIRACYMTGNIMPIDKALLYVDWKANNSVAQQMTKCLISAMESIHLDYESVQDIPMESLFEMKSNLGIWRKEFLKCLPRLPSQELDEIEEICWQVEHYGKKFADQLKYMLILKKNKQEGLQDGNYQQLFQMFLNIFGFKMCGFPNMSSQTLQIGDATLSCLPGFLVMEVRDSLDLLIVGDVTEECRRKINKNSVNTQSTNRKEPFVRHVSEELLGEHAKNLLSHIHLSIFGEKGIFGIIVQATKVSLTALLPERGYMEILNRRSEGGKEAWLNISKECNMLTREGRQRLLKPLLDLIFLQRMYKIKGKNCYT